MASFLAIVVRHEDFSLRMTLDLSFTILHPDVLSTAHDMLHPAHLPIRKPHLDSSRVICRIREQLRNNTIRKLSGRLVLLEHNLHQCAWYYVVPKSALRRCI